MKKMLTRCLLISILGFAVIACRGQVSTKPPIHLNPNMDNQEKYDSQEKNRFFSDQRSLRKPVLGTVEVGGFDRIHNTVLYQGKTADGLPVKKNPLEINMKLLERGRERFNIFCAVCHDRTGSGKGLPVKNYQGLAQPMSYHEERLRLIEDGYIFDVITHGVRTMPSYRHQIPARDRWAIIAYIRALQRSQNTTIDDVPDPEKSGLAGRQP
jgi:mono/diheme cytochrome c family protein